jgi:hypothetical protein
VKRAAGVIALFIAAMLFGPGVGTAAAAGCVEPVISSPADGLPGQFDAGPAPKPSQGDPDYAKKLAAHKRLIEHPTNDYERYGWGGLSWQSYDPDECDFWSTSLNDVDVADTGSSFISNAMWNSLVATTSAATSIVRWSFSPTTLGYLTSIQQTAADVFGNTIFRALFFVTILCTGIYVLAKSSMGNVAGAANSAGWLVLVMVAAIFATLYPTVIGPKVDQAATGIVAEVSTAVATGGDSESTGMADSLAENLRGGLLYETWTSGTFGRSDGYAAQKYGPQLYKAAALTRAEQESIDKDPSKAGEVYKAHAEQYDKVVRAIKDDDRVDRETVKAVVGGKKNAQVLASALAWVGFWCLMLFILVAAFLMLFGLIVNRVALMVLPGLAVVGGFPPLRKMLTGLFDYVLGALAAAVLFGSFAMVMAFAIGQLLGPPAPGESRPPWLVTMLLMIVLTVVAWKVSKPMRHVRTFINVRPKVSQRLAGPDYPDAPNGWNGEETPRQRRADRTAPPMHTRPAEASTRTVMGKAALSGAVQGAIGGLAMAAVTGGTSSVAGAASGAARGAAVAGAGAGTAHLTGSGAAGAIAATAAGKTLKGLPATPATATPAEAGHAHTPVPDVDAPVRIYTPDKPMPGADLTPASSTVHDGVPVYSIFTPED